MRHTWRALNVVAFVAAAPSIGCSSTAPEEPPPIIRPPALSGEGVWQIGARAIPPPAEASDALRGSIAATPVPDPAPSGDLVPASPDGWKALVAARDEQGGVAALALADTLSVSIEQTEIAGIVVRYVRPAEVRPEHADHLFVHVHAAPTYSAVAMPASQRLR